jgi:hypothetical protein
MSGNTENAYMQFLLYGADTAVHKTAWAATYVTATIDHNRIGMTGGVSAEAGIYTRSASGWSKNINVADETQLRAAVLVANAIITVTAATSIVIADTNLVISNNVTIKGNGKTLSGKGIEITSGAVVSIDSLTVTGVDTQPEGMYAIMVQGASTLNANYITMTLSTLLMDNTGFNVSAGSTLNLSNSTLTWSTSAVQQFGVYAQSGATAVRLSSNTFDFNALNSSGAYSYLIGMEGALVANYPVVTLTSNTKDSYMNLLMSGADTVANKEAYANAFVTDVVNNNQVGIIDGTNNGVYTKYTDSWGVKNLAQFIAATAVAGAVVNLSTDITLTANLTIANGVTIHDNGLTLLLAGFEITTAPATVVTVTRDVVTVVNGSTQSSQTALVAVPTAAVVQISETTTMTTTGGTGDGVVSYLTTSPVVCSVSAAGIVTGLSVGSCLITATKAASGNYFAATSSVIAITISDSAAIAKAKAAADQAVADATKAAADAAAKVIADKAAADAAAVAAAVGGSGEAIAKEDLNTVRYAITTKTKTIVLDLADQYADTAVLVEVKKSVVLNGKTVVKYVAIETVVVDQSGRAMIKTLIGINVGNVIRVSVLDSSIYVPIKYVTVK